MKTNNPIQAKESEKVIRQLLKEIGENPEREGLQGTPERVVRMWGELFKGYDPQQAPKITTFRNGNDGIIYDQMIVDTGTFHSQCEHHMLPFFGRYWFAYIPHPKGKLLGLSKIARTVDYFSAKLQIQERLVAEIVRYIEKALDDTYPPLGIALMMQGEHLCKTMRGAKKQGTMTTTRLTGIFIEKQEVRQEFLNLTK